MPRAVVSAATSKRRITTSTSETRVSRSATLLARLLSSCAMTSLSAALGHPKGVDSSAPWFAKPLEPASSSTGTPRRGKHRHARAGPDEFQVTAPLSSQGHVGVLVSPASSRGLAEARASPKPANRDMLVEPVRPQPKEGRLDGRVPISGWRRRKACRPNRRRSRLQYRTGMPETRSTWVRGRFAWSANETTTQTSRPCWSWKKADPLS